jgi:hypothetical protein
MEQSFASVGAKYKQLRQKTVIHTKEANDIPSL